MPTSPPAAARTDEAEIELFEPDPLDPEPASPSAPVVSERAPSPPPAQFFRGASPPARRRRAAT